MNTDTIRKKAKPVLEKFGVERAVLFGSYARGDSRKDSDIDILLKLKKNLTLFDILRLKTRLEKKLDRRVDLVEYDAIKPGIRRQVLKRQTPIL